MLTTILVFFGITGILGAFGLVPSDDAEPDSAGVRAKSGTDHDKKRQKDAEQTHTL